MRDLILDNVDQLNPEYRRGTRFKNFFQMSSADFETLITMIGPKISIIQDDYDINRLTS